MVVVVLLGVGSTYKKPEMYTHPRTPTHTCAHRHAHTQAHTLGSHRHDPRVRTVPPTATPRRRLPETRGPNKCYLGRAAPTQPPHPRRGGRPGPGRGRREVPTSPSNPPTLGSPSPSVSKGYAYDLERESRPDSSSQSTSLFLNKKEIKRRKGCDDKGRRKFRLYLLSHVPPLGSPPQNNNNNK